MATIREILRECPNRKFSTKNQKLKGTRSAREKRTRYP